MKTKVVVEPFLGDAFKVIACQIDDLWQDDDLQCDEILAMIEGRVLSLKEERRYKVRPAPSSSYLEFHNSDNFYTLTRSKKEDCASDRLDVIEAVAIQMITHDRLKPSDVVKGCESYIRMHLTDGEDAPDLPKRPPSK